MRKALARVKRFDEVDSDSDAEAHVTRPGMAVPSLTFKTASVTEDSDSIAFESDNDPTQHSEMVVGSAKNSSGASSRSVAHPSNSLASALKRATSGAAGNGAALAPTVKTAVGNDPPAAEEQPLQSAERAKSIAVASMVQATLDTSTPLHRSSYASRPLQPTPVTQPAENFSPSPSVMPADSTAHLSSVGLTQDRNEADNDDGVSDEFIQHVLPLHPNRSARGHQASASGASRIGENNKKNGASPASRLDPSAVDDTTDELLVRAQLRLEERRRMGKVNEPGSSLLSPWRSGGTPSVNRPSREGVPGELVNRICPTDSLDPRIRRLQQENTRLQAEVAFLGRENQKLRGVKGSAEASEAVRLQLTVDMLRKELEGKQLRLQHTLDTTAAEVMEAKRQTEDAVEQCESYRSAADQYKHLYSEKQNELGRLKTQLQSLMFDVNSMEEHQRSLEAEYAEKVASEREKAERALALVEEVKRQRDHLQFLNTQLRNEVSTAVEAKRQATEQASDAANSARRHRNEYEQRIQQLNEDIVQLRKTLADRERAQEVQLREAQQAQATLHERLKEHAEQHHREAERSRCTLEALREDHKRALQQERVRRVEMEERLRQMEEEGRATQSRHTASLTAEAESRSRKLREEVQAERLAREAAEREVTRLTSEMEQLRESVEYHQQETRRMSTSFTQSEQLREKVERQCASLTHTLEDMMMQEEAHAREIEQLKGAIPSSTHWDTGIAVARGANANGILKDLQELSDENDRLTGECTRIAGERDALIEENGRIAEELLKWKHEMRQCVTVRLRPTST